MPRITAPVSKLTRSLAESQRHAGIALMPKYAELLGASSEQSQHSEVSFYSSNQSLQLSGTNNASSPVV